MAQEEDTDVAIVVAPTNGIVQTGTKIEPNQTFTGEKVNVGDIAGILGLKQAAEVETTTITGASTVNTDSTTEESTTKNVEATTVNSPRTTSEFNALFFLDPKRQVEIKTTEYDSSTTTTTISDFETTDTDMIKTTKKMKVATSNGIADRLTDLPFLQMDQALPYSDTVINFADTKREAIKSNVHKIKDTSNALKAKTPTTLSETGTDNTYQKVLPDSQRLKPSNEVKLSTMVPIVLTPIDNSLANYHVSNAQTNLHPTESVLSKGLQTPSYGPSSNNNKQIISNIEKSTPNKSDSSVQDTTPTSTTEIITTYIAEEASTRINITSASEAPTYTTHNHQITVTTENSPSASVPNKVKFPTESSKFIRFPTDEVSPPPYEASTSTDSMLDASKRFEAIFNQYGSSRGADLSENKQYIFRNNPSLPLSPELSKSVRQRYDAHINNHRNREKYSEWYHLPPKWTDTSQKPVVLRFSKKHGYIDSQQLGSNNFYREINPRLFNFPSTSRNHR
ncbi:hypothetical protein WA026_011010 [Henosepilachna vigintioctopunctata]|uniref:Uncharacterized protein n=1 Tax=Henosepilachna vigintioctopunctata TaxID=420089 RepID=A0AAW1UYF2_9CUCU